MQKQNFALHHIVHFELLKSIQPSRTCWNEIMSFKGLFVQGPTEAIIAKRTCGALEAAVWSLHNIPLNTQEEPHWSGNKEPNLVAVWLTRQTVTLLMMNIGGRQRKPVVGFHTITDDTVVNCLEICWWRFLNYFWSNFHMFINIHKIKGMIFLINININFTFTVDRIECILTHIGSTRHLHINRPTCYLINLHYIPCFAHLSSHYGCFSCFFLEVFDHILYFYFVS